MSKVSRTTTTSRVRTPSGLNDASYSNSGKKKNPIRMHKPRLGSYASLLFYFIPPLVVLMTFFSCKSLFQCNNPSYKLHLKLRWRSSTAITILNHNRRHHHHDYHLPHFHHHHYCHHHHDVYKFYISGLR